MDKKLKIAFLGLYDDDNLGDPVIAYCTERMYLQAIGEEKVEVKHVSLNHYMFHYDEIPKKYQFMVAILRSLPVNSEKIISRIIQKAYIEYFDQQLCDVDAAIVVGGGLIEFTGGRFADGMYAATLAGNKYGFPVIITASGVEGYDATNEKCMVLKKMLHQQSLKYVSTRDDYDTLVNQYFDGHPTTYCEKVADPAVWAAEIFGVEREENSKIVGIGIVRKYIFENYGFNFSAHQLKRLYIDIVKQLLSEGQTVHLFSNGTSADSDFAYEIQAELQSAHGVNIKVDIPATAKQLIEILAQYCGVIAGRLHSCIISYSLNIPAMGLVWNDKLKLFGCNINEQANFVVLDDFDAACIVAQLNKTMAAGYNQTHREAYRATIKKSIESNSKQYILCK